MKHIAFPSIEQYRSVVYSVTERSEYAGRLDNNEPIYDNTKSKPVIEFEGSVKLHGTNSSVCYNAVDGMWAQSRETALVAGVPDNAGFRAFHQANKDVFANLFNLIEKEANVDYSKNTASIFGEWCGQGIMKGVAINNNPKSFFIFGVKITPIDNVDPTSYWLPFAYLRSPEQNIYNIKDYDTFKISIDFNKPGDSLSELERITALVEAQCPVAKAFGLEGIGEGVVWIANHDGQNYRFKVKGEKHSKASKERKVIEVDTVQQQLLVDLANKVTPDWRLEQMLEKACNLNNGGGINRKQMGDFLKMVVADVVKEDSDLVNDAGVEMKDLNKYISNIAKDFFFEKEKTY